MQNVRKLESPALADSIAQQLLDDIVAGAYGEAGRLPAERDLALRFGASRGTVREAIQTLARAGVVAVRRGSGAAVQPRREWKAPVLPAFARSVLARRDRSVGLAMVRELLTLRRDLVGAAVTRAVGRLGPGSLDGAREAVGEAWAHRADPRVFTRWDVEVARRVLEAAGLLVPLWLLNDLFEVYVEAVEGLVSASAVPDHYREHHERLFAALESGDRSASVEALDRYLADHDRLVLGAFGG